MSQIEKNVFEIPSAKMACSTSLQLGHASSKSFSAIETYELKFEGCHIILFGSTLASTVIKNGCTFKFYASGSMDLVCPSPKGMETQALGCTFQVGRQSGLEGVSYTEKEGHIDIEINVTGIKYNHVGFLCGSVAGSNGTFTGEITVEGRESDSAGKVVSLGYSP